MQPSPPAEESSSFAAASGRLAHRLLVIGENRLQLLLVELEEERERCLRAVCLAIAVAVFGLLAGLTVTMMVVLIFWDHSPVVVLAILCALYAGAAGCFAFKLVRFQKDWQTLPATIEQLKKDRECMEKKANENA